MSLPPVRRYRHACAATLVGFVAATVGIIAPAQADTLNQANKQAKTLAVQISRLQPQVDAALAAYDTALTGLGQAVLSGAAATQVYANLQQQAADLLDQQDAHIAALYETGGSLALYITALRSGDPADLHTVPYLNGVVASDAARAANARRVAGAAKATITATQSQIDRGLSNADVVNQRLADLQGLLAEQQALLNEASGRAKNLQALKDAAVALAASQLAAAQASAQVAESAGVYPIPPVYKALYQGASTTCPGLSWTVLAAIGQVETHHGMGGMVSSAGALGPMQFLPPTFVEYARDGDHDGKANIMDPADAIYSAAAYLCANGAGAGGQPLYNAVWNYNHADWYVQLVLALSAKIT